MVEEASIQISRAILDIRKEFPILNTEINGNKLVYFDNAATTQKPSSVIEKIREYYENYNSNVHRGVHSLSQKATEEYENARNTIAKFINAKSNAEIIFTKGTTDGFNLLSYTLANDFIKEDDEIIISEMEHHANIVPWQILVAQTKAKLRVIPLTDNNELNIDEFKKTINEKTKIVSILHVSNALGTEVPIKEIIDISKYYGALTIVDAAQSIQHTKIDVQKLDCDFLLFSGHKLYGPLGIGILYGKEKILDMLPPYQTGGEMIETVSFDGTTFNSLPFKFEAGTPNIVGAIGLSEAIKYVNKIGLDNISKIEDELLQYADKKINKFEGLQLYSKARNKKSVLSFNFDNVHHSDLGTFLDKQGIAVRTGHHCTQPLMKSLGITGTVRASFAFYNTFEEIDTFIEGIDKSLKILR